MKPEVTRKEKVARAVKRIVLAFVIVQGFFHFASFADTFASGLLVVALYFVYMFEYPSLDAKKRELIKKLRHQYRKDKRLMQVNHAPTEAYIKRYKALKAAEKLVRDSKE